MPKEQHILVIRTSAMGDVAMVVPVIQAVLTQNTNVKITILTPSFFAPIFKDIKNVTIHPFDKKEKHKGILGLWKLYKELKKYNFTAIADIHNVLRTKVLKLFFGSKKFIQIDKGRKEKKDLVSGKKVQQLKSTHERYADVFRKLNFSVDLDNASFLPKKESPKKIKSFLEKTKSEIVIGIAPFAAHKSKMYDLEKMKIVIEQLAKEYSVLLFGSKSEAKILATLETNNAVLSVAGKLNFTEELQTISNLDCMLSMDSGNGHLAAMYGVKVVSIWGVTHPYTGFAPFKQPQKNSLLPDKSKFPKIPTSIYGNKYPTEYLNAASSISVEKIIEKIKENI